jgi:integrase
VDPSPDALLFPAPKACHYSERTFRDAFALALKSVGKQGVRIHDLRHAAGTMAAMVGNLVETKERLGHATTAASMRYQHVAHGRAAEIADQLSELAEGTG